MDPPLLVMGAYDGGMESLWKRVLLAQRSYEQL